MHARQQGLCRRRRRPSSPILSGAFRSAPRAVQIFVGRRSPFTGGKAIQSSTTPMRNAAAWRLGVFEMNARREDLANESDCERRTTDYLQMAAMSSALSASAFLARVFVSLHRR
uniref:Uncharacterized protein n=1 Tax=Plectus sambesii TaxID=2011161 RepID=A0A914WRW5_9BILA